MSIREFLKSLNYDQLLNTRSIADELIQDIESSKKIKLLIINDGFVNVACFYEHDFDKAKKKLCELIASDEFMHDNIMSEQPNLYRKLVFETEVADYMSINA